MASLPPPTSIPGIAVDEVLIIPEIQDLLMADASDDAQGTSSSGDNDTGDIEGAGYLAEAPARSEAVAFEEQLDGEFRPQKTTRSIPECIVATSAHAETAGQIASPQQDMQQQQNNPPSSSTAPDVPNVSSTGQQHIQRMSHADIDGLCYKLQARTASLGDDKHEKAAAHQQKAQIRGLRAELSRLRQVEAQLKQYEQRPVAALEKELQALLQEVADLSGQLQDAAQEELDWTNSMASNLRV
ncbi:uncharacterized protein IUM83_13668 [Phytophthora cinnamomi]|uniref:uncharacterized protein n=1 Tax=Phytophthora cinnamomi TaxID=4785 RepID=UPI00355ABE7A|nr:hypothetical protein IUM83_13668 [Phytophthora cinnamomi]